jgi:co-chaperonin GroES (HSP10)
MTSEAVQNREPRPEVPPRVVELTPESIPVPTGWRLLVAIKEADETYSSGILKADQTKQNEEVSSIIMQVVDMGPDAYADTKRFPSGPWCKIGDYVLVRAYAGTRFKIHGREMFRLINDDTVEAVVADPSGYTRI